MLELLGTVFAGAIWVAGFLIWRADEDVRQHHPSAEETDHPLRR